jgi:hypothetical protein
MLGAAWREMLCTYSQVFANLEERFLVSAGFANFFSIGVRVFPLQQMPSCHKEIEGMIRACWMLRKTLELPLKFLEKVGRSSEIEKTFNHWKLTFQDA